MAITQPTPETSLDPASDLRWQPPLGPHPGDPQRTASEPYTGTDAGAGITTDSLQAWQTRRAEFGTFVRADVVRRRLRQPAVHRPCRGSPPTHPTWSSPTTVPGGRRSRADTS